MQALRLRREKVRNFPSPRIVSPCRRIRYLAAWNAPCRSTRGAPDHDFRPTIMAKHPPAPRMRGTDEQLRDIAEAAACIVDRAWGEASAGNISVRLPTVPVPRQHAKSVPLQVPFPMLGGAVFLVTATGTRMRDIATDPARYTLALRVSKRGDAYAAAPVGGTGYAPPTSELAVHLAVHAHLAARGRRERAVVHAHATEVIAITHNPAYCAGKQHDDRTAMGTESGKSGSSIHPMSPAGPNPLTNLVWSMHPEAALLIPRGVAVAPYARTGTQALADATVRALEDTAVVVWEKHGILAVGDDCMRAFDLIDVVAKALRVYFL
ncbi:MAG: class II aldolase/adducin family protein, partial [Bacteroidota bacterium]|nr:class II aldolase/adducin family protein [Bacteroidota bacterium]